MKAKAKARELVKIYYNLVSGWTSINKPDETPSAQFEGEEMRIGRAKQCALIHCDGIIDENLYLDKDLMIEFDSLCELVNRNNFWQEVKQEIEKL